MGIIIFIISIQRKHPIILQNQFATPWKQHRVAVQKKGWKLGNKTEYIPRLLDRFFNSFEFSYQRNEF